MKELSDVGSVKFITWPRISVWKYLSTILIHSLSFKFILKLQSLLDISLL